jgi:cyanate permease
MTAGRLVGPVALDRFGRLPVLIGSSGIAILGVLLVVHGAGPALVSFGIVLWGLGCALGFPVGMSAAADDPVGAARRVGVVATIGYAAFLTGPPLLGALGDAVGTLRSLLAVGAVLVVALFASFATRRAPG